jgi:hypothetical protein
VDKGVELPKLKSRSAQLSAGVTRSNPLSTYWTKGEGGLQ